MAGLAKAAPSLYGRHSATSTRRWVLDRSTAVGLSAAIRVPASTSTVGERNVTVVAPNRSVSPSTQAAPAVDALAVDERAVAREAVVDDRPVALHALEQRVHAGDLVVPVEHHVHELPASDRDLVHVLLECDDVLPMLAVTVDQERHAGALGVHACLQVGDGHADHYPCPVALGRTERAAGALPA